MTYQEMQRMLMEELRLYHYPIAVKFFYDQAQMEAFKKNADQYHSPLIVFKKE